MYSCSKWLIPLEMALSISPCVFIVILHGKTRRNGMPDTMPTFV
jgi:hypothetical protein